MIYLVEIRIWNAVRSLLLRDVNALLAECPENIPPIEYGEYEGVDIVRPEIIITSCESGEKERILRIDTYTATVAITAPPVPESQLLISTYAACITVGIEENRTLGGIAQRAAVSGKKYLPPDTANRTGWGVAVTLRITIEGAAHDN